DPVPLVPDPVVLADDESNSELCAGSKTQRLSVKSTRSRLLANSPLAAGETVRLTHFKPLTTPSETVICHCQAGSSGKVSPPCPLKGATPATNSAIFDSANRMARVWS